MAGRVSVADYLARLDGFAVLEGDWDSYGGLPISPAAIALARRLVECFGAGGCLPTDVAPICDGGIQLEWEPQGHILGVEVMASGQLLIDPPQPYDSVAARGA